MRAEARRRVPGVVGLAPRRAHATLLAVLLLLSACSVPQLQASGKTCDGGCGAGYLCEVNRCVAVGQPFCQLHGDASSCLDFESGDLSSNGWSVDTGNIHGQGIRVGTQDGHFGAGLHSDVLDGGSAQLGRLSYPLPSFSDAKLGVDFRPALQMDAGSSGFVALAEFVCCAGYCHGVWFHYLDTANGPAFVLRTGEGGGNASVLVEPQPTPGQWNRVELEAKTVGTETTAYLTLNGGATVSAPLQACSGSYAANVGLSPQGVDAPQRADFDNVLLEVTP